MIGGSTKTISLPAALVLALMGIIASGESASAWTLKVIYSFCNADNQCPDGYAPISKLIKDSSGDLFGTVLDGGQNGAGAVFELIPNADRSQWHFKAIYSFCTDPACNDGANPYGNLIMDNGGNLYGGTTFGGTGNSGVIFKLSPKGKYEVLYSLCPAGGPCNDGIQPTGLTYAGSAQGLPYDGSSPLYGVTGGGATDYGNVFALEAKQHQAWSYRVIHSFCATNTTRCADGGYPTALLANSDGSLLGTALLGGETGRGLIFKLALAGGGRWSESVVYDFCLIKTCPDGARPYSISSTSDGRLIGTTSKSGPNCENLHNDHECGVLFEVNTEGSQYSVLHGFCAVEACADGRIPFDVFERQPEEILGVTEFGGKRDVGSVFQFQNGSFQSIYQFCSVKNCRDGKWPETGLTADPSGSLFGTTTQGGAYGYGEVFELSP